MNHICPISNQSCDCDPKADSKTRSYPCRVARQLGKFIRLMASDIRGEAENASAAFLRLCQSENLFSHLAELLERRGVRELYSQAEVEEALNIERQLAQAEVIGESAEFFDAYGEPLWHAIALFCQRNTDRLTRDWDKKFVDDLVGYTAMRDPTPKQIPFLLSIFLKLGGQCDPSIKARYIRR